MNKALVFFGVAVVLIACGMCLGQYYFGSNNQAAVFSATTDINVQPIGMAVTPTLSSTPTMTATPSVLSGDKDNDYLIPMGTTRSFNITNISNDSDVYVSKDVRRLVTIVKNPVKSVASISSMLSPNSPAARQIVVSNKVTPGVVLGVFALQSANMPSVLRSFTVSLMGVGANPGSFSKIQLQSGTATFTGTVIGPVAVFNNLNINLAKDAWQDLTIKADVAANLSGVAAVTLVANPSNIVATFNDNKKPTIVASTISSNSVTFAVGSMTVSNTSMSLGTAITSVVGGSAVTTGYNVSASFTLTNLSNNDYFVAGDTANLINQTININGMATSAPALVTVMTVSPSTYPGDVYGKASVASYVIPAGTSRTFTLAGAIRGWVGQIVNLKITGVNYGPSSTLNNAKTIINGLENLTVTASF